jgi:hypothetical protein
MFNYLYNQTFVGAHVNFFLYKLLTYNQQQAMIMTCQLDNMSPMSHFSQTLTGLLD